MRHVHISGGDVYTPSDILRGACICIRDGVIAGIGDEPCTGAEVIDASGCAVAPGLIDIHTHGAFGWDASVGPPRESDLVELARLGTTSLLPTVYPVASRAERIGVLRSYAEFSKSRKAGAEVLGIHMEGPYLNPELGAQLPEWCETPAVDGFDVYLNEFGDLIKAMTLSPELEGSEELVKALSERGAVAAVGHSCADRSMLERALAAGLSHATHIFNATRRPSPVLAGCVVPDMNEFCLAQDEMTVDTVVDGQHIHVDDIILRLVWKCKGPDKLILISDSMSVAGLPPGSYPTTDGRNLVVDSTDVCRFEDGTICGSKMTVLEALKNLMVRLKLPLTDALPTATSNPAKLLGIGNRKGAIAPGMDADIIVLDKAMNVQVAMVGGTVVGG